MTGDLEAKFGDLKMSLQLEGVGPRMMAKNELMMEKTTGCLKDIPSQKSEIL